MAIWSASAIIPTIGAPNALEIGYGGVLRLCRYNIWDSVIGHAFLSCYIEYHD